MVTIVTPARVDSKRITNKDIKLFQSKPRIAYPIAAAKASKIVSQVVLSTDSEEIAEIAEIAGVKQITVTREFPFFIQQLSADHSSQDGTPSDEIFASLGDVKIEWVNPSTNDDQSGVTAIHLLTPNSAVVLEQMKFLVKRPPKEIRDF